MNNLKENDIEVREFGTKDYRLQIKRENSKPCYQLKKDILEALEIRDRLNGWLKFHEMQPVSDQNMHEVDNLISTLRSIRDGN